MYARDPVNGSDYSGECSEGWFGVCRVARGWFKDDPLDATVTAGGSVPVVGWGFDVFALGRSLNNGNWGDAGWDTVGFVPFVGDAAKAGRKSRKAYKAADAAKSSGKVQRWSSSTNNILDGTHYSDKVKKQIGSELDKFHSFSPLVDNSGSFGKIVPVNSGDGLGHTRVGLHIPGAHNGTEGTFQYIIEQNGEINHRMFVPNY